MNWKFWRTEPPQPSAALFGKHPSRPDFLREGCRGGRADALDRWLVSAAAQLQAAGAAARLPVAAFCQSLPGSGSALRGGAGIIFGPALRGGAGRNTALVGVLGPSADSEGRAFPVAIFRELALERWSELEGSREFLAAARELISHLPELELEGVRDALAELPEPVEPPRPLALPASQPLGAAPRSFDPPATEFLQGALAAAPSGSSFYALSTLTTAFNEGADTQLTLDCPIRHELDAQIWLELAERLNRGARNPPPWLLSAAPPRLLISIGSPSPELLRALSDPSYSFDQLWPLTTTRQRAIEQAQTSLLRALPELADLQRRPLSIGELGERLARAGRDLSESW